MNVVPIDPVFSNWLNLNIKVSIINCSTNSKSCKANYFFLRNSSRFFSVSLRSLLFSNFLLALFIL